MPIFSKFKNLIGRKQKRHAPRPQNVRIIERGDHYVSRADISQNALKVMTRLNKAGFEAYLVGGSVRDLLVRCAPKDFDVATNAKPEEIRALFRNCRLIGRRFRLAHILYGREIIEVATFRAGQAESSEHHAHTDEGLILRDNVYGTLEDDAWRRDFTINALYYSLADFSIVDYTGGFEDLKNKMLRIIGDPRVRYQEDPVRMLRVVRFAAKLDFRIERQTEAAMAEFLDHLELISSARLFEETLKLFLSGRARITYQLLEQYGLFAKLLPATQAYLAKNQDPAFVKLMESTLDNTDERVNSGKPVTPAFFFAALLWGPLQELVESFREQGIPPLPALENAMADILQEQVKRTAIPKRLTKVIREIWLLQYRLERRYGRRPMRLLEHPRFRAGYDFLLLRVASGTADKELADWWTEFQAADPEQQQSLINKLKSAPRKRKYKPRKKKSAKND